MKVETVRIGTVVPVGPTQVKGYRFDGADGLAITPSPVLVNGNKVKYAGYTITHLTTGRGLVWFIPSPVEAYRLLREFASAGVDWTQSDEEVRKALSPEQARHFRSIQWHYEDAWYRTT